ncbi:MAG: hypothetical protein HY298_12360 [Verrucomicrobia bacterium]|nr:hypothetical protein [Verrucomicrobiota bacterium]
MNLRTFCPGGRIHALYGRRDAHRYMFALENTAGDPHQAWAAHTRRRTLLRDDGLRLCRINARVL